MKKSIVWFLSLLMLILVASCEDNRRLDIPDDKIYLSVPAPGEQLMTVFNKQEVIETKITIIKGGTNVTGGDVTIATDEKTLADYNAKNSTSYKMMPADAFSLDKSTVHFEPGTDKQSVKLQIFVDKLAAIQPLGEIEYVLPLKISSSNLSSVENKDFLVFVPQVLNGIRPGSEKEIWRKTLPEMNINGIDHFTVSLAATEDYLYVNTRNQDLKYYDLFTGEYVGTIALPFKSDLGNFTLASDNANNLIISNLRNQASGTDGQQTIYIIKSGSQTAEKLIDIAHPYKNGRKISVRGDLQKNALILSSMEDSSNLLYWTVTNGVLKSQMPEVIELNPTEAKWFYYADAISLNTNFDNGIYLTSLGAVITLGYFENSGSSFSQKYKYNLLEGGFDATKQQFIHSLDFAYFNERAYLCYGGPQGQTQIHSGLFDVTSPANLSLPGTSPDVLIYKSEPIKCTGNTNMTGDVCLQVSKDGSKMLLFTLGTNGGISAVQFDCIVE